MTRKKSYRWLSRRAGTRRLMLLALSGLILILFSTSVPHRVGAQDGADERSPSGFGYGVTLDPAGRLVEESVDMAAKLGLDWLALTLDWSQSQPDPSGTPDVSALASVLDRAYLREMPVLLAITRAPAWAMTARGPDPARIADLIQQLAGRFPAIRAVELFPPANTAAGWGAAPDPGAYLEVLRHAQRRVQDLQLPLLILAGGLQPANGSGDIEVVDDLVFLESLYMLGGAKWMPVLTLRPGTVQGAPLATPYSAEPQVLRRYELIRQVMLAHNHQAGMIWVTAFSWPSGTIAAEETDLGEVQALWLHEAYNLLSAQLYIGAAFFQGLNPPAEPVSNYGSTITLIEPTGRLHPGLENLSRLATSDALSGPLTRISVKHHKSLKHRFKHDP